MEKNDVFKRTFQNNTFLELELSHDIFAFGYHTLRISYRPLPVVN